MNLFRSSPWPRRGIVGLAKASAVTFVLALSACGGGDDGIGVDGAMPVQDARSARTSVAIEPVGPSCVTGGAAISAGVDSNNNAVLDAAEVTSVSYVCNGANGIAGAAGAAGVPGAAGPAGAAGALGLAGVSTLVHMQSEPSGAQCAVGGTKITAGHDTNGNATLDASEVSATSYVCGGAPGAAGATGATGAPGAAGANGLDSLTSVNAELAGVNCTTGGVRVVSGVDSNRDNVLQLSEVTSTQYVCTGAQGAQGSPGAAGATGAAGLSVLVATVSEAVGANCSYGGTRITSGQDANANNVLDGGEVAATSYVCNGAGVTWIGVSSASVQASRNTGYAAQSASRVTVTLPASPTVADIVRVTGMGSGGWQIGQNAGQSILTQAISTALATTPAGINWTVRDSTRFWISIASSDDGSMLVAADYGGQLYTSTDSGVTWTARDSNRNWQAVASSADGSKLLAAPYSGQLYTSTDSGVTWTARDSNRGWQSVASSADGSKLVAAAYGGQLYTSPDSGASWIARESVRSWLSVASSADGSKLVAVAINEQVYTSTDTGVNWTPRDTARNWYGVASSADGGKLVAVDSGGQVYTSTDSGITWTARESGRSWRSVASSADGSKLFAGVAGGRLYTSVGGTTTPGTTGWLRGGQYDAVELQFVGNGLFIPLSFTSGSVAGIVGN
ncbi:MAG: hypothetical protein H0U56_10860 [Methylibium sp.]|nr:hypothetical protein [Methylibium sp.]